MRNLPTDVSDRILAVLITRQGERQHQDFADVLGIAREHWSLIRAGRRKPSYAVIRRAAHLYPEIAEIVLNDLTPETVPA